MYYPCEVSVKWDGLCSLGKPLLVADFEALWPYFKRSMEVNIRECAEKNKDSRSNYLYKSPYHDGTRVYLNINNQHFQGFQDVANHHSQGSTSTGASSDIALSPLTAQTISDHTAIDITNAIATSQSALSAAPTLSETPAQNLRRNICDWCSSCWERNDKFWLRVWPAIATGMTLVGTAGGAAIGAKLNAVWSDHSESGATEALGVCNSVLATYTSELAAWRQAHPMCPGS